VLAFAPNTHRREAYYKWRLITDDRRWEFVDIAIAV
jgi:hypothetical protein